MLAVAFLLPLCSEAGSYDADKILLPLRIDDDRNSAIDLTNCDESILNVRVSGIKDLQVVLAAAKELRGLRERQTVLLLVATILGVVPLESHAIQYKPMTEWVNGLWAQYRCGALRALRLLSPRSVSNARHGSGRTAADLVGPLS